MVGHNDSNAVLAMKATCLLKDMIRAKEGQPEAAGNELSLSLWREEVLEEGLCGCTCGAPHLARPPVHVLIHQCHWCLHLRGAGPPHFKTPSSGAGDGTPTQCPASILKCWNPIARARPVFISLPSDAFLFSRSSWCLALCSGLYISSNHENITTSYLHMPCHAAVQLLLPMPRQPLYLHCL